MSWGSRLLSFMSFGLRMACWDTPCRCEEKQQLLPHTSHLNPSNSQLHDTLVPGGFDTCTRALETNEFREIDHDNLHCVDPTGLLIPSASAVPTNSLTPFIFNIETPSRFENTHIHTHPLLLSRPSNGMCLLLCSVMVPTFPPMRTNENARVAIQVLVPWGNARVALQMLVLWAPATDNAKTAQTPHS